MKKFHLLLLMTTLLIPFLGHAEYSNNIPNECGIYAQRLERERNRLNNYEIDVIEPMIKEMERLEKTINYRTMRPKQIVKNVSNLETEIRKLEVDINANSKKIDLLTREAETLEAQNRQKDAKKKINKIAKLERKNIKKTSKIERNSGQIDDLNEEAQEISSAQPPLPRLEKELAYLERQLADQEQIKRDLMENVGFYNSALGMCSDYQQLRIECGR